MKMRSFALAMVFTCVLGLVITVPIKVFSELKSAPVTDSVIRPKVNLPSQIVPENIVEANTITVKQLDTKNIAIVQLNSEVNSDTISDVMTKIKKVNKENKKNAIYLLLDSPGGSVFEGIRLITAIENSKIPVYTIGVDFCASMCAHILEHGKERYMIDRSRLMFHPASTMLMQEGEVDKIYSRLGAAKRAIDKLDMYDAKRSGQNYVEFKARRDSEYWTDAEDALQDHLIDAVVNFDFEKEVPNNIHIGNNNLKLDLKD